MNNQAESENKKISRRHFFSLIGWGSFTATCTGATIETVRFFFPNVLYEPPTTVKIGLPEDYPEDSMLYNEQQKFYTIRDDTGFFVISAVCTHLGCTVTKEGNGFLCPCHGAIFDEDGLVTKGPALNHLPRFRIVVAENGELQVDTADEVNIKYRLKV